MTHENPTADELNRWWNPAIREALTSEVQRIRQTIDLEDGHITAGVVTITYLIDGWRMCAVYNNGTLQWAGKVA
jgi:hypothetical protein